MIDFLLIPVDHEPDFGDASLIPVDHDPFNADGIIRHAQTQMESQPQRPAAGADLSNVGAPASAIERPSDESRSLLLAAAGDSYPSADAAAIAALQDINPTSQHYGLEHAGRIYQKWFGLGSYSYTPPSEGTAFSSSPGSRPALLLHSLGINAGTYHTHTPGTDPVRNEDYSSKDKQDSDYEGTPSYLGAPSGIIYKYSPNPNQPTQGGISVLGKANGSFSSSPAPPQIVPKSNQPR